ncbi:MAG: hypothetical protein BGO70_12270 [Bacteroidetes bacterium 43-93]|nr:MAG: hypothetical protein BGO70_12270 [Bacteroidetes bacterium 43-93]
MFVDFGDISRWGVALPVFVFRGVVEVAAKQLNESPGKRNMGALPNGNTKSHLIGGGFFNMAISTKAISLSL